MSERVDAEALATRVESLHDDQSWFKAHALSAAKGVRALAAERDAAGARAEKAERERDEAVSQRKAASAQANEKIENQRKRLAKLERACQDMKERARDVRTQRKIVPAIQRRNARQRVANREALDDRDTLRVEVEDLKARAEKAEYETYANKCAYDLVSDCSKLHDEGEPPCGWCQTCLRAEVERLREAIETIKAHSPERCRARPGELDLETIEDMLAAARGQEGT